MKNLPLKIKINQSKNKEGFTESLCKAESKAAIDKAVSCFIAMRKPLGLKSQRVRRNSNIYKHVIKSLGALGMTISKEALQQRVSRALKEETNSQSSIPEQVNMFYLTTEVSSITSPDGEENSPFTEPSMADMELVKVVNQKAWQSYKRSRRMSMT